jgi:AcrR family transcriptional regulator
VVSTGKAPSVRRTQEERSTTTRAALTEAAIELLIERGWAAVTAVDVCVRAGVSRGAFHHHYTSVPALFADALERLYEDMRKGRRPATTMVELINRGWAAISARRFKAIIEAWLAMANDPTLRDEIGPVMAEFSALLRPEVLAPNLVTGAVRRDFAVTARETMFGLALGRAASGGKPLGHERRVLARLRADAAAIDADR